MRCRIHFGLAVALGICSCSSGARNPESWTDVLSRLTRSPGAIYAPGFRSFPPEGSFLRFSVHPIPAAAACGLYEAGWDSGQVVDLLRITTNRIGSDSYRVVESVSDDNTEPQAYARLIQIEDAVKTRSLRAAGGWLIGAGIARSLDEWHAGALASVQLHLEFPRDPIVDSECTVSEDKLGTPQGQCTCTLASGKTSTCFPRSGTDDCCLSAPAEIAFDLDVAAAPCAAMCIFTDPSLATYCEELQ
jgi:hypothetical protein